MRFVKTFTLLAAGVVGGVLGNLLAGFIQDDLWNNIFTLQRLAWTLGGIIVTTVFAAWIDARREDSRPFPATPKNVIANPVAQVVINAAPFNPSPVSPPIGESIPPESAPRAQETAIIRDTVSRASRERVHLVRKEAIERLAQSSYSPVTQDAFSLVFGELVNNAFEHGCASATCSITVEIEVTWAYVILVVKNGRGIKFNVDEALQPAVDKLRANPHERRGRGLVTVYNLADTLEATPNHDGVKAAIYHDRVVFNTQHSAFV
jgi:anti-sigma regulatory factor (Ser/Thr protein kinase)